MFCSSEATADALYRYRRATIALRGFGLRRDGRSDPPRLSVGLQHGIHELYDRKCVLEDAVLL